MRTSSLGGLLFALLVGAMPVAAAAQDVVTRPVARLGPSLLTCSATRATAQACAGELLQRVRAEAELGYVTAQALHASPDEIEVVRAYDRAFRTHDRWQRTRKLAELNQRLAANDLVASERERLEKFRATLERLAQYEADVDSGVEPRIEPSTAQIAHWVVQSKLDSALYHRYGGVIGIHAAGPYAHGARAALVLDYLSLVTVEFLDHAIEVAFRRLLAAPPPLVFQGENPDFTPFWKRAIPASYMVD